jgi:hypothetical protein
MSHMRVHVMDEVLHAVPSKLTVNYSAVDLNPWMKHRDSLVLGTPPKNRDSSFHFESLRTKKIKTKIL